MQLFSLEIDDCCSDNYSLIGIHSVLEDYRLAFLFNNFLKFKFKKAAYDLDFKNEHYNSYYSVFEYTDKELALDWFLIANLYKGITKPTKSGLFNESDIITYLLPEKKKIDYFLKIEGDVDTEYTNTLKSKNFLIF